MNARLAPEMLAYQLLTARDPQISPDGSSIVYALAGFDAVSRRPFSRLWVCRRDGSQARPLTSPERRASGARWSPGGERIAFTSSMEEGHGLFVMSVDPDILPQQVARHSRPLGSLAWSPDGLRVAYTTAYDPDDPHEERSPAATPPVRVTRRIDYKDDDRGYVGDARRHVFVVGVADRRPRRVSAELVDHAGPLWSPDGRWLAMEVSRGGRVGSDVVLLDIESGQSRTISPEAGMAGGPSWAPCGDRVFYLCDVDRSFHPDYFVYHLASGKSERLTSGLLSVPAAGPGGAAPSVWLNDHQVLINTVQGGEGGLEIIDIETRQLSVPYRQPSRLSGSSLDRSGRFVVQVHETPTTPGEISVFDRDTSVMTTITDYTGAQLAERPPATWERLSVRRAGFSIDAWLLKPPDFDPEMRYPVVLDVHGGPSGHHSLGFVPHQQCLATHGFLVVCPNPGGSTSYGGPFARRVIEDWGGADLADLLAVLDAVLERPYADPTRVGIYGYSYGGYMTAWAISQTDRFSAAVCGAPIFDLMSDYGTSDAAYNGLERHGGGAPHARQEWYLSHSPSTFAHQTRTPTLIIHGEADYRCPIGQGEQMFTILKKAGCEVEFARYPGASHMFFVSGPPDQRVDFLSRVLHWFQGHLGNPEVVGSRPNSQIAS